MAPSVWGDWLDTAISGLGHTNLLRSLRPVQCDAARRSPQCGEEDGDCLAECRAGGAGGCNSRSLNNGAQGGICFQESRSAGGNLVSLADDWNDEEIRACNRSAVEVSVSEGTIQSWLSGTATSGTNGLHLLRILAVSLIFVFFCEKK